MSKMLFWQILAKRSLNLLAAKHLKLDEMITVVVGDKAKVLEKP